MGIAGQLGADRGRLALDGVIGGLYGEYACAGGLQRDLHGVDRAGLELFADGKGGAVRCRPLGVCHGVGGVTGGGHSRGSVPDGLGNGQILYLDAGQRRDYSFASCLHSMAVCALLMLLAICIGGCGGYCHPGRLVSYAGFVYRSEMAKTESDLAYQIIKRKRNVRVPSYTHIDKDIAETEKKFNVTFAAEQREAIRAALTNGVSIITGGPGTGKTMIQKAIIEIYRKNNSGKDIKCCAPTGRAARRMTESTGFDASTIHKALNLFADDSGNYSEPELLDADFVIVDEVSMLDIHIAEMLFDALKHNCQIVLIGDSEQLPSVGPGAVLSEMIESRCVPTVRLDTVFRQNSGSRIAVNARLIRHGDHELEYGDDFEFINSPNLEESAKIMVDTYIRETSKYGIDNVALLTPFRKKTATGVNSINESVREIINPGAGGITFRNQSYRHGDKVMQIKNHEDVNNGDIGYITDISKVGNDNTISIDFGGGKIKEYDINDMDQIDLGYASTIHKSQGSEYKSVIINIQNAHYIMLNRPLIYTAITRSKEKVIIIGDKKALHMAISKSEINRCGTCLAMRLIELSK